MSRRLNSSGPGTDSAAVSAVRRSSVIRRVAVLGVAAFAIAFIVTSVFMLTHVEEVQSDLAASVVQTSELREIEANALELRVIASGPGLSESLPSDLAIIDRLAAEIDGFSSRVQISAVGRESLIAAASALQTLRSRRESGSEPSSLVAPAFDVIDRLAATRDALRRATADVSIDLYSVWSTTNRLLIAACLIAALLAVSFFFAIRHGDARRILELEMEHAFERASAGVAVCDDTGIVQRVNEGFRMLFGCDDESIVGASVAKCLAPDAETTPVEFEAIVRSGASAGHFELTMPLAGGATRIVACHLRAMASLRGARRLWALRIDDVTEQRRGFAAIAERADWFAAMLAASRDGMALIEPSGRIAYANRSFADLTGTDPAMLTGMVGRDFVARVSERSNEASHAFRRLFGERDDELRGSILPFRAVLYTPGARVLLLSAVPVVGRGGRWLGRLAIARDVTQEDRARRAKDVFLGNVSHELRTPLTSISGFVDLLNAEKIGPVTPRQREVLRVVAENVTRLSALVGDLLAVGEIEEGRLNWGTVDLAAVVSEVVELERVAAEAKGLRLEFEAEGATQVEGDEKRLRQLVSNLVSNGIKYTREGSVRIRLVAAEQGVQRIEIADTGIGIDEHDRSRIFERFFRAENADTRLIRGTGLGLAIAKLVVDQHGGRIEVESTRGKGSTFRVWLPCERGGRLPMPSGHGTKVSRAQPLVLAIDDDVLAHRIIIAALRICRIDVVCAEAGEQGIQLAIERRPDVVLVDIELPDINGFEVVARLQREHQLPRIPIVVLSGREAPPSLSALGIAAYLQKPVRSERLREAVLRALGDEARAYDATVEDESGVI